MVVSRCRVIGPPSGIVLGTLFLVAADLRRQPTPAHPYQASSVVLVWPVPREVSVIPRAVSLRVSLSQSTGSGLGLAPCWAPPMGRSNRG